MARNHNLYISTLQKLKEQIINGVYPFQSQLPSEMELAEKLNVSRSTLRKVLAALKEDGLIESHKGCGSFVCDRSVNRYIPVIIPKNSKNYRLTEIFEGSDNFFNNIGFSSLLTLTDDDPKKERVIINKLLDEGHKNFIIYPTSCDYNSLFYQRLLRKGCNCVFIDTLPSKITCDYVTSCNFLGGYEVTKKLMDLGHKNIAFCSIPNPETTNTVKDRFLGYISALEQHKKSFTEDNLFIFDGSDLDEFANHIVKKLSSTAIFASTDELAVILVNKFADSEKKPVIIGFDNSISSENFNLTSVNQNLYEIGRTAAELLHKRITNPLKNYEHIYVPIRLIERSSLKRPNQDSI